MHHTECDAILIPMVIGRCTQRSCQIKGDLRMGYTFKKKKKHCPTSSSLASYHISPKSILSAWLFPQWQKLLQQNLVTSGSEPATETRSQWQKKKGMTYVTVLDMKPGGQIMLIANVFVSFLSLFLPQRYYAWIYYSGNLKSSQLSVHKFISSE